MRSEVEELMNESNHEEDEITTLIRNRDYVDLVISLPPPNIDDVKDVEGIDEDVQVLNDPSSM